MADTASSIDQIIAGGAGAGTTADFSKLSSLFDSYYKARDETAKNDLRDAFKDGVPTDANGQPDFGAMAKTLFQKGGLDQGVAASNLDIQRQGLQQNREGAEFAATGQSGGQQPTIVSPPSVNRSGSAVVAPPLNRGGTGGPPQNGQPPQASQGQPGVGTLAQALTAQGIPNDQIGPASASLARQIGLEDPNAQINFNDPQIRNVVVPAIQQLKRAGIGQVQPPQGQPPQAPPQQPQMAPQQPAQQPQPQAPNPFANAQAAGLIPPGVDPNRFVAGLKYRAAALPKGPAQELIQSQVNAIDKASELTSTQRDFNASQANPKIDERAAQQKADEAHATGVAQSDIKEQDSIISSGAAARQRLATLNTISNIINTDKNMSLGFGAETSLKVKKALESIGIDVGDLSGPQAIQKLNGLLASESAKGVSARPAQFEFKTFLTNNPGLDLDKAGNQRVIGIFSQLAKRDVDLGKLARQNRDDWQNWDNVVENYDKQNPIKDPVSGKPITTNSIVAPGPAKTQQAAATTISSKADYDKLPSGATFTGPDGKPWRKP
jgi:hypothetical protein